MNTMIAPRSQVVPEIAPSSDSWQASYYSWHESENPGSGRQQRSPSHQQPEQPDQNGCGNFRTLLSSEALTEVWESLLGRTASQDHVIDCWSQLLNFN